MSTHSPCDDATGCDVPFPPAPSADLLGSPVQSSRGALSHIGKRGVSLRLRAPTCLELRPTGRYRNLGSLPHMHSSVEDGCGLRNTQCNTVMYVYGVRCSSEPAVWVPDREDRLPGPGSKQAGVCSLLRGVAYLSAERELSLFFAIRCRDGAVSRVQFKN